MLRPQHIASKDLWLEGTTVKGYDLATSERNRTLRRPSVALHRPKGPGRARIALARYEAGRPLDGRRDRKAIERVAELTDEEVDR